MFMTALGCVEPYAGNSFYDNVLSSYVRGNDYGGDVTAIATLRCLLYPRDCQDFRVLYKTPYDFDPALYQENAERMFCRMFGESTFQKIPEKHLIIAATGRFDCYGDRLENAKENAWKEENNVKRLETVERYMQSKTGTRCRVYIHSNLNTCVILLSCLNHRVNHLLISFLPLYFPAIFKDKPISAEEKSMLQGLSYTNPDSYMEMMWKLSDQTDIQDKVLSKNLSSIQKASAQKIVKQKEAMLETCRNELESLGNRYEEMLKQLTASTIEYEGAVVMANKCGESKELVDYFKSHKNIRLISADESYMKIIITDFIDSFDVDGYEHISKNEDFFNNFHTSATFADNADKKLLMDGLFNEMPDLKVKSCSMFMLDLAGGVRTESGYNFSKFPECKNRVPNPHFQRHACIGNNRPLIADQLQKGEIVTALECCLASAAAVNIHETTATFRPFMEEVFNSINPILFNTVTNTDMTPEEALKWLKEKESK